MTYVKVDTKTMKLETTSETLYVRSELEAKKIALENSKQYSADRYDIQIAEVDRLIAECEKLGIKK